MSLLRWHTPTPPQPVAVAKQQPTSVSSDRLASLMKQTHYQESKLTDLDELDILAEYKTALPARWTDDMRRQPKRYVYQMMAELEVENNPLGATQLAQELQQQLLAASGDRTPMQREPPIGHPHGAESVRDHLGADNIVRHMHRTPSAYNRGPPVGKDPYLGTGLNPAHVSGVVSPNDGAVPEMACCGQPFIVERPGGDWVAPPGCWIQLQRGQLYGQPTPYQTWFTQESAVSAAELWQRIALNGALGTLTGATVTGTAFVNENYYRDLDTQIRKLIDELAPAVFQVYQALLNGGFTQPSGFALLNSKVAQDKLVQLVALVQRYNAPQMGACHHDRSITGDYLDEHVFFISVGRAEFRAGRLVVETKFGTIDVPLITGIPTTDGFNATAKALGKANVNEPFRQPFLKAASIIPEVSFDQNVLQENKKITQPVIEKIQSGFLSVGLPNPLESQIRNWKSVYETADVLVQKMTELLTSLPTAANEWLRRGVNDEPVRLKALLGEIEEKRTAFTALSFPDSGELKRVAETLNVADKEIDTVIATNSTLTNSGGPLDLPEVRKWARASIVANRLTALSFSDISIEDKVVQLYVAAIAAQKAKKAVPPPPPPAQSKATRPGQRFSVQLNPIDTVPPPFIPDDISLPLLGSPGYKYDDFSCSYDTLFAALFMIPKQWFRDVIVSARTVQAYEDCQKDADTVHKHLIQVIRDMEQSRDGPIVCPTYEWWKRCMRTGQGSNRTDNPLDMLVELANFYGVGDSIQTIIFNVPSSIYKSFPTNLLPDSTAEMVVINNAAPGVIPASDIPVTLSNGQFTITACIVRSEGKNHWQVCLRDPRKKDWVRCDDDGKIYRLTNESGTLSPIDIRGTSYEPTDKGGYSYLPVFWFYVRTERLLEFSPGAQLLNQNSLDWQEAWRSSESTSLRILFGSELRGATVSASVSPFRDFNQTGHEIGVMQILYGGLEEGGKNLVLNWIGGESTTEFINQVNDIIISKYLDILIRDGIIGNNLRLADSPLKILRENAFKASMTYFDDVSKKYFVPYWGKPAGKAVYISSEGKDPADFYPLIARRWALVLRILLMILLKDYEVGLRQAMIDLDEDIKKFGDYNTQIKK